MLRTVGFAGYRRFTPKNSRERGLVYLLRALFSVNYKLYYECLRDSHETEGRQIHNFFFLVLDQQQRRFSVLFTVNRDDTCCRNTRFQRFPDDKLHVRSLRVKFRRRRVKTSISSSGKILDCEISG